MNRDAISYRDLFACVDRAAGKMYQSGVSPQDRVVVDLPRSINAVIAILAALSNGAAYVPLDPRWPAARKHAIILSCQPRMIVTDDPVLSREISAGTGCPVVSGIELRTIETSATADLPVWTEDPELIAYILFTSGSTGIPKGVKVSHRAALAFLSWTSARFALEPEDVFANFASFSFDLSVFDLFNALHHGATLDLIPEEMCLLPSKLADYIVRHRISVWYSVPWILTSLVRFGRLDRFPDLPLRIVLFAGEVFPIEDLKRVRQAIPGSAFYNLFGPTETNVCTYYEVPLDLHSFNRPVPIGRPCCGDRLVVMDIDGRPVGVGEDREGELLVAGPTVMSGYWGQQDSDCWIRLGIDDAADVYYRTGDLVRYDPDGNLCYLGRRDDMIKRRGFRIEPAEIEHAARSIDGVEACAVVSRTEQAMTRIILWIAPELNLHPRQVNESLASLIPEYMLPDSIRFMASLPRNPNGKIDKEALKKYV